jgi:hypothetical protein
MGLMIHSLDEIPSNAKRDYYLYLLDYGWKEPLSQTIVDNFEKIADSASKSNSVFIKGTIGSHVDNEILSWHHINGENGEKILPAILITTLNPHLFKELEILHKNELNTKIILIPLKKCCKSSTEVINLINQIFKDINDKKPLEKFEVFKEMKRGIGKRILDGVILKPTISGIGFDLKAFFKK